MYVMRAASSKGAADLIVLWPAPTAEDAWYRPQGDVWLVQCKRDGKLPKSERETLIEIAGQTGAIPVLARVPKAGRGVVFINLTTNEEL